MEAVFSRISKFDNAKFLLIFLVVLGHVLAWVLDVSLGAKALFLFIYLFHMPAFIFISGLFSKKNIDEKRYFKIFNFLIWFYIMKLLIFGTKYISFHSASFKLLRETGVPWYMFAMFVFSLMTIFLKRFPVKYVVPISILTACIAGYFSCINSFLVLSRILVFYPFFLLGYYLDNIEAAKFFDNNIVKLISAFILILVFVVVYFNVEALYILKPFFTGEYPYNAFLNDGCTKLYRYGGFLRLLYYPVVSILAFAIISICSCKKSVFSDLGTRTMQVYVLHSPLIILFFGLLNGKMLIVKSGVPIAACIFAAIFITVILSLKCLEKPFLYINNICKKRD